MGLGMRRKQQHAPKRMQSSVPQSAVYRMRINWSHGLRRITLQNGSVSVPVVIWTARFDSLKERLDSANVRWSKRAFEDLRELGEEIAVAYG